MPLTKKGTKIKKAMKEQYDSERGEQVFYAYENKHKGKKGLTKKRGK